MDTEKRFFEGNIQIEQRADGQPSRRVVGYAAVFDKWSRNFGGWFKEKIDKNAFDEVLDQDTVALFNHNQDYVLARNGKTLTLSVDETGLKYEFDAPNTTAGNDLLESISRGDITGSSFQFTVKESSWRTSDTTDVEEERTIVKVDQLIDVAPVTFPAYPDTTVAKRVFDAHKETIEKERRSEEIKPFEREILRETINIKKRK